MLYRAAAASIAVMGLVFSQAVYAATDCWSVEEARAAHLQDLNTMLMIESLKCEKTIPGIKASYAAFSDRNHDAIVRSKHMIEDYFVSRAGPEAGRADYLEYETALANEMSSPAANYNRCADMVSFTHMAATADENDLPALANTLAVSRLIEACPTPVRPMAIDVWDRGLRGPAARRPAPMDGPPSEAMSAPADSADGPAAATDGPVPIAAMAAGVPEDRTAPAPAHAGGSVEMVDGVPTDLPPQLASNDAALPAPVVQPAVAKVEAPTVAQAPAPAPTAIAAAAPAADPAAALQAAARALALAADALKSSMPRASVAAIN